MPFSSQPITTASKRSGTFNKAVPYNTRGPHFESSHWQFYVHNFMKIGNDNK